MHVGLDTAHRMHRHAPLERTHVTIIRLIESHDHSSLASTYLLPRDVLLELLQCSLVAFADGALSDVSQP